MKSEFYRDLLYPFQDQVLHSISGLETGFHLTGGTALSRGYLNHRFSDDLDFFVNDHPGFRLWGERIISALARSADWQTQILLREERYIRINLAQSGMDLKIEMINDVPARVGMPWQHPVLGLLDTAENILANKVTAVMDRAAPKDLADIWGLCCSMNLSLSDAILGAQGKAAGIFPLDLSRVLCSAAMKDWELVRWVEPPPPEQYLADLDRLGRSLIFR